MAKRLNYIAVNLDVQKVQSAYATFSLARRHPPAVEINRHGRGRTNVEGAEEWRLFFEDQQVDPLQPWVTTGTNKAQGLLFMYPATKSDAGAIAVRWDEKARVYHAHFGGAMRECPSLRPVTKVDAQWKPGLDKEGKPCLVINVKAAKPKRAEAADPETLAARAEEAAAKKAARAAARERIAAAKSSGAQGARRVQPAQATE